MRIRLRGFKVYRTLERFQRSWILFLLHMHRAQVQIRDAQIIFLGDRFLKQRGCCFEVVIFQRVNWVNVYQSNLDVICTPASS